MDNKEIIEEIRKENQEREAREKRYKVRKVEHYTEELYRNDKKVLVTTFILGFLSVMSAWMLSMGFSSIKPNAEIKEAMRFVGMSSLFWTAFVLSGLIHSIVRKVGLEQRIKDIKLELEPEVDNQTEEEKVKTLSLENGTHGTKH